MLLRDWAKARDLASRALGQMLGISAAQAWRMMVGDGFPKPHVRRKIYEVTGGAVDANALAAAQDEFLELAPVETLIGKEDNGRQERHSMD